MGNPTVGETRGWLEAAYGVPNDATTHFVIVADSRDGARIIGCCDGTDEAGQLLAGALGALTGRQKPRPESGSVIVSRLDLLDLLTVVALHTPSGIAPAAIIDRLAEAAGVKP